MSEDDAISRSTAPATAQSLLADLRALGLGEGDTVLTHTSMSQIGWISGGAEALAEALLNAIGPEGTLVVPAQTGANSDPQNWRSPPVPAAWWGRIRDTMPPFDPARTPTRMMGVLPEFVRLLPGAVRSPHPQVSFAAIGPKAEALMHPQPLEAGLGEASPLARLYADAAKVALLGIGFERCTAFHLAEHRSNRLRLQETGAAMLIGGKRIWRGFVAPNYNSDDFEECGRRFRQTGAVRQGPVGAGQGDVFSLSAGVDFATAWLALNRTR